MPGRHIDAWSKGEAEDENGEYGEQAKNNSLQQPRSTIRSGGPKLGHETYLALARMKMWQEINGAYKST